jgi:hydrogenase maturation factor
MFKQHARQFESASMVLMVLGIVALCQPWSLLLHQYSVAMIVAGLVAFNVFSRIETPEAAEPAESTRMEH